MKVMLACNDDRNGLFVGKFDSLIVENDTGDVLFSLEGEPIKVVVNRMDLRIMNSVFPIIDCTEWYGNWCWNMYLMDKPTTIKLLNMLHEKKWDCIEGLEATFGLWEKETRLTTDCLGD